MCATAAAAEVKGNIRGGNHAGANNGKKVFLSEEIDLEIWDGVHYEKKERRNTGCWTVVRYETKNVVGYQEILPAPLESCK